jgi:molybdopterin converting factor small subunit
MNLNASITLELTGPLERAVGRDEVVIAWSGDGRLGDLLRQFCRDYPAAAELLGGDAHWSSPDAAYPAGMLVIRDSAALAPKMETAIAAGDRLTLMPLISGG